MNTKFILGFLISVILCGRMICMDRTPEETQALLDAERLRMQEEDAQRSKYLREKANRFKEDTELLKKHTKRKNRK